MSDIVMITDSQSEERKNEAIKHLESAASLAATWEVVPRPSGSSAFHNRIRSAAHSLEFVEKKLASLSPAQKPATDDSAPQPSPLLDLRANTRTLRATLNAISENPDTVDSLPRIIGADSKDEPRIEKVAHVYLRVVDGEFSRETLSAFIHALQAYEPLTLDELWSAPAFLQFSLMEWILDDARSMLSSKEAAKSFKLQTCLKSLQSVRHLDWSVEIEPLIAFDAILRQDPAGTYSKMDFESRERYRKNLSQIAKRSDCTETDVARKTLELATAGSEGRESEPGRFNHVGYYLIGKGFPRLAENIGFHPSLLWRIRRLVKANAEDMFIGGNLLLGLLVLSLVLFPVLPRFSSGLAIVFALLALLPSSLQAASDLVNHLVALLFEPDQLPKLDFSKGIPAEYSTMVVVPSLLLNEEQVRELITGLEVRFLANQDPNLHYALLTDLSDSASNPREKDMHPLVDLAVNLIDELNSRYAHRGSGAFLLLHRHRIFNTRQRVWMSWERKRGKLIDLNQLLAGEYDAFPIKAGDVGALKKIRYVLTLDSDTQLPRDAAARLVGTIAHPLNQAVVDPKLRIVTDGYGILQPRVGIAVRSTVRSRLAAMFSGYAGLDTYSHAVSNGYQDLFGEGVFTGKGIYEAAVLHTVLNQRFPRNELLSHDLIEGAYARAGLVTDVELIDDYPSHYSAYSRRQHRWMRGDWQIAGWLFGRVRDESGKLGPNPISAVSRWKIFDNLRRSLVEPSLLILFVAGWLGLPGGALYWTIAALLLLSSPAILQLVFSLGRGIFGSGGSYTEALTAFKRALKMTLLQLALLLHQTLLASDAVLRSLIRRYITGERLLEWETAAQAELQSGRRSTVDRYLAAMSLTTVGIAAAVWLFAPSHRNIGYALPFLLLWALSGFIVTWLNRPPHKEKSLASRDSEFLQQHALRIWRYFSHFSSPRHHFLIPDNVEEEGMVEAARVSPTNIGLLLNARQAACEFGFLTIPEFADLTRRSLTAIAQLEKWRGNLYNWYDTESLKPLGTASPFVSSVDSGNFVASLYVLRAGTRQMSLAPLLSPQLFFGLAVFWRTMRSELHLPSKLKRLKLPGSSAAQKEWIEWLPQAESELTRALSSINADKNDEWWIEETLRRVTAIRNVLRDYLPWAQPEMKPVLEWMQQAHPNSSHQQIIGELSISEALEVAGDLCQQLEIASLGSSTQSELGSARTDLAAQLRNALINLRALQTALHAIAEDAERLVDETEFAGLVHPTRKMLSVGYDIAGGRTRLDACYDMIASEARTATFLAIVRGDLPQQSWFNLGRDPVAAYERVLPASWTGTMFEYLMPGIWMHSYRGTLIERMESASVFVQRAFAEGLHLPWGISESGAARRSESGPYHYEAYGIPRIALSHEANAGPVISPYSTFLAIGIDTEEALRNLRRMASLGWVGPYGFYEAADYSKSTRKPIMIREWMSHHQGMSLLALTNLLRNNVFRQWFHSNPAIQATELLLHEKPLSDAILRAKLKKLAAL